MKQLKTLALFTVLFVVSACSTSGNDTKNNGTDGGTGGNGGGSDAFLTAISKYSKMTGTLDGKNAEVTIGDGRTMTVMAMGTSMDMPKFTFVKSLSGTKAEYSQESLTPNAVIEISGATATLKGSLFNDDNVGDANYTITLTLVE